MKFLHFSDLHLCEDPSDLLYGIKPFERLQKALQHAQRFHKDADFLVITGDLANLGKRKAYENLILATKDYFVPVIVIAGNHDNPQLMRELFVAFDGNISNLEKGIWLGKEIQTEKESFIFLDTTGGLGHSGVFTKDRAQELSSRLANVGDRSVYLFLHHPPLSLGVESMDLIRLLDSTDLEEVVREYGSKIRCFFLGHLHRPIQGMWAGIPFSIVRSLAHQLELDEIPQGDGGQWGIPGNDETPEYNVVTIDEQSFFVHSERFLEQSRKFWL